MINYTESCNEIRPEQLEGFFRGWPDKPSAETHLKILHNSTNIVLAIDSKTDQVIGFITAVSDQILSAYIPLLEVHPQYRCKGIGTTLVNKLLQQLEGLYMIDLCCDPNMISFYQNQGFTKAAAMIKRNYHAQSGKKT